MTTKDLRNNIEKVLGNNIRCLLPSYWWKRLFHQVADTIDTINGVEIVGSEAKLKKLDAQQGSLASVATRKETKISECYFLTEEEDSLPEAEVFAKLTPVKAIKVNFPLPDLSSADTSVQLVSEDKKNLGFLILSKGLCTATFLDVAAGTQKYWILTGQFIVDAVNNFLKEKKFYILADREDIGEENMALFDQIFTIVDSNTDVYVKGMSWERLVKEGESGKEGEGDTRIPSYLLYYPYTTRNDVYTMHESFIEHNATELTKIRNSINNKEGYILNVAAAGTSATDVQTMQDVDFHYLGYGAGNTGGLVVITSQFIPIYRAVQPNRLFLGFKEDGSCEVKEIAVGDTLYLYYSEDYGFNFTDAEKAANAENIIPIWNSLDESFTPRPIIIRHKVNDTPSGSGNYLSIPAVLTGVDTTGTKITLVGCFSPGRFLEYQYNRTTGEFVSLKEITIEGGEGSYDDTGIKKDIADLQAKDKATDAQLAALQQKDTQTDAKLAELSAEIGTHFGTKLLYGGAAYTSFPCRLYPGMTIVSMGVSTAVYLKTKDGKSFNVYSVPYTIEEEIVAFQVNTTSNGEITLEGDIDELKDKVSDIERDLTKVGNKVSDIENNVSELEKQVSHPNIPYMEFGGNLFDYRDAQILSNHYIAGDGTIREVNGWSVSGYITIETNKTYVFKCYPGFFGTSSVKNIPSYAADKTFLNTIVGTLKDNYLVIANTNKEAKYVRVTINSSEIESFMFVEGDVYPSEQKRYDWTPNKYFNQSPVNALYGKTALFDGDSIAAGTEDTVLCGWSKIVGDKNSMDWHSIAVSGGTITNGVYDNGALKHPICLGVDTFYSQGIHNPDYIIFEGGSNDELLGDFRNPDNLPERFGVFNEADFTGPFDNSTFCGALDYLFFKAQSLYPKTKFGFIIAPKMGKSSVGYTAKTHNRRAIFDYIIRSCRKWGIPYIDLWEEGWLNPSIPQHYDSSLDKSGNIAVGSLYTDGQHLTASGYQLISSKIEGWMKTL